MHRIDLEELIKQTIQAVKNQTRNPASIEFSLCVGADETEKKLLVYPAAGQSIEVSRIKFTLDV
jgi:hypothetical protein